LVVVRHHDDGGGARAIRGQAQAARRKLMCVGIRIYHVFAMMADTFFEVYVPNMLLHFCTSMGPNFFLSSGGTLYLAPVAHEAIALEGRKFRNTDYVWAIASPQFFRPLLYFRWQIFREMGFS